MLGGWGLCASVKNDLDKSSDEEGVESGALGGGVRPEHLLHRLT